MLGSAYQPDALWEELQRLDTYPAGVVPVPERVKGTAFFPAGLGLWRSDDLSARPTFPVGGVMVVGNNNDSVKNFKTMLTRGKEYALTMRTWINLLSLFKRSGIKREQCFFTNVYMGLVKGPTNLGRCPGAKNQQYEDWCKGFMLTQLEAMKPGLVITLGAFAMRFFAKWVPAWRGVHGFRALDQHDTAFIEGASLGQVCTNLVAIVHPSLRHVTARNRTFGGTYKGEGAEVELLKYAFARSA